MQLAKLYKQGGSVVFAVPHRFLRSLGWKPGDELEVMLAGQDQILARKLTGSQFALQQPKPCPLGQEEEHNAPD